MTVGVIIYHKNALKIYEQAWIDQCVSSIQNQTYNDFVVFEMDYGGTDVTVYPDYVFRLSQELPTYADAMNKLLDIAFCHDLEYVFNVNIDDYYAPNRFERQLELLEGGAHLVSTFFEFVNEYGTISVIAPRGPIKEELDSGNNVICHPSVAYSKTFWENCSRYDPAEVPTYCRHHAYNASHNESSR